MNKNYLIVAMSVLLLGTPLLAQEDQEIVLQYSKPGEPGFLEAGLIHGGITVEGTDGEDIVIKIIHSHKQSEHKVESSGKHAGMRRIGRTAPNVEIEERNNRIEIHAHSHATPVDLHIKVPHNTSLSLSCINQGDIMVSNVEGDMEINNVNGKVTMENISGSVVAHALNQRLKVVMTEVAKGKAMSFSSLTSEIDVTLPASVQATLKLENQRGNTYTDFEVDLQNRVEKQERSGKRGQKVSYSNALHGDLNGGGPLYTFTTMQGEIYIRKGE